MIPWELNFSGVRDFKDTRLEFGGTMEHVLITGPNGSGKSTITFCIGAVLGSPKVDLEGLRSRNLPQEHVWRATIQLVFQNAGAHPVDAAAYIGFRINLEQRPTDPLRKEYWILEGDNPQEWSKQTRYTSGDGTNHLHEYRHQLQHKYRVDPDTFYLIWYQQDVNQFAVMRPEERFRIFSEMTGIDRMQHNWERVKEERKDALAALQTAEGNQHQHKLNLGNWRQERDRLVSRNERRKEGLRHSLLASASLRNLYAEQRRGHLERIEELEGQYGNEMDRWMKQEEERKKYQAELEYKTLQKQELEKRLTSLEQTTNSLRQERDRLNEQHRQLADQLHELAEQWKAIPYAEHEVRKRLEQDRAEFAQAQLQRKEVEQDYCKAQVELDRLAGELAQLSYAIADDQEKLEKAESIIAQYGGSAALELEAIQLEEQRSQLRIQEGELESSIRLLKEESRALTSNEVRSRRQDISIRYLRGLGLTVYTMRDLLEMDEQAPLDREERLEAIKYSLFVDGRGFIPPTDLYHVELPAIVPERALDELSELGLKVKAGLEDKAYAAAQKALWWVNSLVNRIGNSAYLDRMTLVDALGRRGAQEEKQWVLNPRGIALRLRRAQEEGEKLTQLLRNVQNEFEACEERWNLVRSVTHKVKDAESVVNAVAERDWRKKEQKRLAMQQEEWTDVRNRSRKEETELNKRLAELDLRIETFARYAEVYDRYQEESANIWRLQQLSESLEGAKRQLEETERELEDRIEDANQLDRSLDSTKRRLREKQQVIEEAKKALEILARQKKEASEHRDVAEQNWAAEQQFHDRWVERLPFVWAEMNEQFTELLQQTDWNEAQARNRKTEALVQLEQACGQMVDENAMENYEKVKQEFERGAQEVEDARVLLQQLHDSLIELEEKLISTTNYEVKRVHTKFVHFMDNFGFDGEVSWSMQEMKQGNMKYFLTIKARKQGHRGPLEEVGVKGRGGRVGKGVSGGEESLSSLLFALALLKTLQSNPGYIVLDEFDSALDENRKAKVFQLYETELARKMIILSPKSHESDYLQHFQDTFVVYHDARIPQSAVVRIKKKESVS